MRKPFTLAMIAVCAALLWGCSSKSPQQAFAEALMRGNSMQASQIWLHMSPDDRMKFARGEGVQPEVSKDQIQQQIRNHQEQQSQTGPMNATEMEQQIPTPLGASIQNLVNQSGQSGEPSSGSQ